MADHRDVINFIQEWEGGISGHPADNASANASPCGIDPQYMEAIHTNKGVTWLTFQQFYGNDCDLFLAMPQDVWLNIFKNGYWDKVGGDAIENQGVANMYAEWAWMSGAGGAFNQMSDFLKSTYGYTSSDVSLPEKHVLILNYQTRQDPEKLFYGLTDYRRQYLLGLSDAPTFANGWINRLNAFIDYNKKYIMAGEDNDSSRVIIAVTLVIIGVLAYFILIK